MNVVQMRNEVSTAYKGREWEQKVKKMNDNQIIAIYHRLSRHNKFGATGKYDSKHTTSYEQLKLHVP